MKKSKVKNRTPIVLNGSQVGEIQEAFKMFDSGNTGKIESKDLKVSMRALGFEPQKDDLKKMISGIDKEALGQIDFNAFLKLLEEKMNEKDSVNEIEKAFDFFKGEDEKIDFKKLKESAKVLKIDIKDYELRNMIQEADVNGTGKISLEDFVNIVQK